MSTSTSTLTIEHECPVCFETDVSARIWCSLPCSHDICYTCLFHIIQYNATNVKCPMCRESLQPFLPDKQKQPSILTPSSNSLRISEALANDEAFERIIRSFQQHSTTLDLDQTTHTLVRPPPISRQLTNLSVSVVDDEEEEETS